MTKIPTHTFPQSAVTPKEKAEVVIEARVFRRLLEHLDAHKDIQNIDMMITARFCRNCLAKWYSAAAAEQGVAIEYEQARERIYGMPYAAYKAQYQTPASDEQLAAMVALEKNEE